MTQLVEPIEVVDLTTSVRVTFDRIGRNHTVQPLDVDSCDPDVIAQAIWQIARLHTVSRRIEVVVDLEEMAGTIFAGVQSAGRFKVEHTSPEVWL